MAPDIASCEDVLAAVTQILHGADGRLQLRAAELLGDYYGLWRGGGSGGGDSVVIVDDLTPGI